MIIGLSLSIALGLQATSSALTKRSPSAALAAFGLNGQALENYGFAKFASHVANGDSETQAATRVRTYAVEAIERDPLAPRSWAILALAADSQAEKQQILFAASQINRRDPTLQGLVLLEHLEAKDQAGTIETLDQLLRVHPELQSELFPVLADALADESTIPVFRKLLQGEARWHDTFLTYAVRRGDVVDSLASLRNELNYGPPDFDRRLIASLVVNGKVKEARSLWQSVVKTRVAQSSASTLDWESEFPPFDWQLADDPGFRAQASRGLDRLELSVRPGKGGIIASRLLQVPANSFGIQIKHRISPVERLRDVRLRLTCAETGKTFLDEGLNQQGEAFETGSIPNQCSNMILAIHARAWSGRSALSGAIESIQILAR